MPIMTRMRDNMPVILFGLLIAFVITIVFEWGMDYLGTRGGGGDVIGSVNGRKISYREFSELVQNFAEAQKAQTGNDLSDDQLRAAREQVWQSLVTQYLVEEQIGEYDISVTDQELVDWVHGDTPPEDLRRNFVDSTGQFRRDIYEQFLQDPNQFIQDPQGVDPNYGTRWLAEYEQNLRQRRMQEKLQSLILATVRVTEGELLQRYLDQNVKFSSRYALFEATALVPEDQVTLTDENLKRYYEDHTDQYRVPATRSLQYVVLPEQPSAADSSARLEDMEDAARKARAGAEFLDLVYTYSDRPDSGAFFRRGEMSAPLEEAAFSASPGEIVGPLTDQEGVHLLKVLDERRGDREYVRARHILFTLGADSAEATGQADSVAAALRKGADFAELATQFSQDPGSASRGGDLGWFTRGRMTPAFEEAAFSASPGEIVGPFRSPFGLHILELTDRDSREVKLAYITMRIDVSPQTRNDLYERAADFAFNARQSDFSSEAGQMGFTLQETSIQEEGGVIPGIGVIQSVSRWAFTNSAGEISEPFTVPGGYAVFAITEENPAGVRPFTEVKESVRPLAMSEARIDRTVEIAQGVRDQLQPGESLSKVSELNPAIDVRSAESFTLAGSVPGVGRDQSFVGTVAGLEPGQISGPVRSTRGAYLIELLSRSPLDSTAYVAQKESLRGRILQDKRNQVLTAWLEGLRQDADIEDHRDLFYR